MLERLGAGAIFAKALARYGKRLTDRDYKELISMPGVAEIAAYLRANTHYAPVLDQVQHSAVHRGNLESLLRKKAFEDFASLCRFESSVGEHFFDYILMRGEITELLRFLRYLAAGRPGSYLFAMPEFFNKHTRLDLMALSKARDYDGLLDIVAGTPYDAVLRPLRPAQGEKIDIPVLGAALRKYQYARVFELIKKNFKGKTGEQLREKFSMQIDFLNLRRIVRGKRFYGESPDLLRVSMIPGGRYLRGARLEALLEAPTGDDAMKLLRGMRFYGAALADARNVDYAAEKASLRVSRRMIRFSGSPAVVMASYITLTEMEIEDITTIIEGVRYGLPPAEISKLLIISEGG